MSEKYTRSRSKFSRNYNDEEYPARVGQGGFLRNNIRLIVIAVAAVLVVSIVIIVLVVNGNNTPASGDNSGLPPVTTEPSASATDDLFASASPDPYATGTDDPLSGDTAQPGDSTEPEGSAQPEDTTSPDTTQPDESSTPDPENSPKPTSSAGSKDDTPNQLTAAAVKGKANVSESLSMRASASSTASVLKKIPKDDTFTILAVSTNKAWLKVKYSEKTGYVLVKYVIIGSSKSNMVCTVTGSSVNVRNGAGKTHTAIGSLKAGDTVIVTKKVSGSDGTWYKVSVDGKTGYVSAQFCRLASGS